MHQTRQRTAARILPRTATTLLTRQTATKYYPGLSAPLHNQGIRGKRPMKYQVISEKTLSGYLQTSDLLLVDLRSREDYEKSHIAGAVRMDWESAIDDFPGLLADYEKTHGVPPAHLVLYCDSGHISLITARDLAVRGYAVMSLNGGFHRWHGVTVS